MAARAGERRAASRVPVLVAAIVTAVTLGGGDDPAAAREFESRLGRWSASGYAEGYAVFRTDRESQRQRPAGIFALTLTGDVHRNARVVLSTLTTFGGPPEHADGLGIYNLSDTFQNISPSVDIDEGYVDLTVGPVDLRIGKQKFAWGKLDTVQPTDVVNPRRYTDPFVMEEQEAKVGVPAVRASYFVPPLGPSLTNDMRLTLVWVPVPVSTLFPLPDERWFPTATTVPDLVQIPPVTFDLGPATFTNPINVRNTLRAENRRPAQQLDEGAVGLRIAGLSGELDWSLYYYDGPETTPNFEFETALSWPAARRAAGGGAPPPIPQPGELLRLAADVDLLPRFGRIRLFGGDVAFDLAGFTVRAEATYGMDRLLPRAAEDLVDPRNLARQATARLERLFPQLLAGDSVSIDLGELTVERDTVAWGAGFDYLYQGWMPLVQVNQTVVLDNRVDLLLEDVDTQLLFVLRKSFLAERLKTEVATIQGLERGYTSSIARFTYELTDNLRVRLGYLFIAGSRRTLIGQYHDNDEGFVQVRYSY